MRPIKRIKAPRPACWWFCSRLEEAGFEKSDRVKLVGAWFRTAQKADGCNAPRFLKNLLVLTEISKPVNGTFSTVFRFKFQIALGLRTPFAESHKTP
jgi:hypothetical protein